jgi:hypothetical protein
LDAFFWFVLFFKSPLLSPSNKQTHTHTTHARTHTRAEAAVKWACDNFLRPGVGLTYKSNSLDPQHNTSLKAAWFQPLMSLNQVISWLQGVLSKCKLNRYTGGEDVLHLLCVVPSMVGPYTDLTHSLKPPGFNP